MRRSFLVTLVVTALTLLCAGGAEAVVVPLGASGRAGVAMVPGTIGDLKTASISPVTSTGPCTDPALAPDLGVNHVLPSGHLRDGTTGLCFHTGGSVLHANETFAVTWDPRRFYWARTRDYVEQFLRNVADASSSLATPYAVVSQYTDATGRAGHASLYGGGCIDYGDPGGATCRFANAVTSTVGQPYPPVGQPHPTSGCQVPGALACLTDDQLQAELTTMIGEMGFVHRTQTGYTPLVVLLLPSRVDACLKANALCSVGSGTKAEFCSYHSWLTTSDGTKVPYVVQPWSADSGCDEPDVPVLSKTPTSEELAVDRGTRLVSPLSAGQTAAIVNPGLDAWYANNGSEINDNLWCAPFAKVDGATLAGTAYLLQREFNNAAAIESDPRAQACEILVNLAPTFVVPSPIDAHDVVAFDGSVTDSTLLVSKAGYVWNFGDGTVATGASVVHTFANAGVYTVDAHRDRPRRQRRLDHAAGHGQRLRRTDATAGHEDETPGAGRADSAGLQDDAALRDRPARHFQRARGRVLDDLDLAQRRQARPPPHRPQPPASSSAAAPSPESRTAPSSCISGSPATCGRSSGDCAI